jgi:uncharacterized protein YndB with AHSA1/START domain
MAEIVLKQRFAAPAEKVFDAITDHEGMTAWMPCATVTLDRPGAPERNGLGAIRRIRARGFTIVEEIVRFERPAAMDYRVLRGGPIRDHLGTIRIEDRAGESGLEWRIRFGFPWWAGGELGAALLARILGAELRGGLERLARRVS